MGSTPKSFIKYNGVLEHKTLYTAQSSWLSDGSEWESGWETDTEDEEQNEGLSTPAERHNLKPSISPDDVTVTAKTAKRALLFAEGK